MSVLRQLAAVILALVGSFLFSAGVDWYLGAGGIPAPPLILAMLASGLLSLAIAVLFSRLVSRIFVGLIIAIAGTIQFQLYTCGGFGPVCASWWSGQLTGLVMLSIGLIVVIWGLAATRALKDSPNESLTPSSTIRKLSDQTPNFSNKSQGLPSWTIAHTRLYEYV